MHLHVTPKQASVHLFSGGARPCRKVSFDAERNAKGHADEFWAVALACQARLVTWLHMLGLPTWRDVDDLGQLEPFVEKLPLGWYRAEYRAVVEGSDGKPSGEDETVRHLLMVNDGDHQAFGGFIDHLLGSNLEELAGGAVRFWVVEDRILDWRRSHFAEAEDRPGCQWGAAASATRDPRADLQIAIDGLEPCRRVQISAELGSLGARSRRN